MGFFFCSKWLRWSRKSSSAAETSQSHPLGTIDDLPAPDQKAEGMTRPTRPQRNPSGGLSHKIRERFSHENTRLKTRPSIFGIASRLTHGPVASNDVGSSLMSEKDYDSDAQHIATPKLVSEPSSIRSWIWGRVSPFRQPIHEPIKDAPCNEPREVTGQTHPAADSPFIEHCDIEIPRFEWEELGFVDSEPTQRRLSSPKPVYPPRYSQGLRFRDPMSVIHEDHQPQSCNGAPMATISIDHTEHGSHHDTAENNVDPSSDHTTSPSPPCTTSADSVTAPYADLSIQKKRRCSPEEQEKTHSVHLGEIDIPRALASTPTSSRVLSRDPADDGSGESTVSDVSPRHSHPVGSFEIVSAWNPGEPKLGLPRVVSSTYSRQTSLSSEPSRYRFESRIFSHLYISPDGIAGCPYTLEENIGSCNPHDTLNVRGASSQASATQSKNDDESLQERERVPSGVSDSLSDPSSTRKVSIGWMSGGRRLGYGYELIPGDDEGDQSPQENPESPPHGISNDTAEPEHKHGPKVQADTDRKRAEKKTGAGKSVLDMFKIVHHFNSRHSSKNTVTNGSSRKTGGNSVATFFLRSPTVRKGARSVETTSAETKTQQNDLNGQDQTLTNTEDPLNGAYSGVDTARRSTKGQILRRATTLWTRRSVGSEGIEMQPEPTKQSSSGPSPPPLQRSKTKAMKVHNPSRRTPLLSDVNDENIPMFPNTENPKPRTSEEEKEQFFEPIGEGDPQRRLHRVSSSNSMDDWFETYQDSAEFRSL